MTARTARAGKARSTAWSAAARSGAKKTSTRWRTISPPSTGGNRNERAGRALPVALDFTAALSEGIGGGRTLGHGGAKRARLARAGGPGAGGGARRTGSHQGGRGERRPVLRRAAHRFRRQVCVRQLGERGRAVLRGAGRPAATQVHPHAARRPRRGDGR